MNTDAPWPTPAEARERVLKIQTKLHRWATDDHHRRFDDLYNLVYDPAVLVYAWTRVRSNRGARTAGVDGETAHYIAAVRGEQAFLSELRDDLKARRFQPVPVRERMIPKASGKLRRLGIATVRDRVAQAALKTVLEPIFEATFSPCSYGFRPRRQAHDAIAETHFLASRSYEWIVEGDIKACFDEISHSAVLGRMRDRIADRRVMDLVKAFLKAGILSEDGELRDSDTGAPQGGIVSPLISNIALSILDEHFAAAWEAMGDSHARAQRRHKGLATYRLIRYADDWLLLVAGDRADAERLRAEAAEVLLPMGLRLSEEKTKIVHIDQGFDFLGDAHPAPPEARRHEVLRVHLPVTWRPGVREGQGTQHHGPQVHEPNARGPVAPAQPGASGLDQLPPARGGSQDFLVPGSLHLAPGHELAAPQTSPGWLEGTAPTLPSWVVADAGGGAIVQPRFGGDRSLPLPGSRHPLALGEHDVSRVVVQGRGLVESRMR